MKTLLMVAYHFPPLAGSSGIQRTLRFVQHLPALGWRPIVLTTHPIAYEQTSDDLLGEIPKGTIVRRAIALDTSRHLAVKGRYVAAMARPDRWVSWRFDAARVGEQMMSEFGVDAIWSTYPIATAHLIGAQLSRRTGLPWIADFRDPMAQDGYPADPETWKSYQRIEASALANAAASTFTTPGAARVYAQRYPANSGKVRVLENGYDEESFASVEEDCGVFQPLNPGALTLLHSGIVYPQERDPTQLMLALRRLLEDGAVTPQRFKVRFRAPVQEALLRKLAAKNGVTDLVEVLPPIGYKAALAEMLNADALLLMQASDCNEQIPAKLYEYLRARRPIVCLSDPAGDTVATLRSAGLSAFARLDNADEIERCLRQLIDGIGSSTRLPNADYVASASRRGRAAELVALLGETLRRN